MKSKGRRPRLAGHVRERGNSRSLVVTIDGKQHTRTVNTRTKKEALAMLPAFIAEVQSGALNAAREAVRARLEAPTFREASECFLRDQMRPDADGASTRNAYCHALSTVAKFVGDTKISEITRDHLHRTLRELHQSGRADGKGGLAVATVKLMHAALCRFFGNAVELGLISVSPLPTFAKLNLGHSEPASERARRSALTRGQIVALIEACRADDALRVWVTVMAATGARPGEALALRWQDVDLERGVLHIEHSVKPGKVRGEGRLGSTKTQGSVRSMPIGAGLASVLSGEHVRQEALLRTLHGLSDNVAPVRPLLGADDCVFPVSWDNRNVPMSLYVIRSRFKRAAVRAGLPASTVPHQLRHSMLTAVIAGDARRPGISVIDAARLAGHSDPGTTSRTYAHAVAANLHRGISLANDLITPSAEMEHLPNTAGTADT